MPTTRVRSAGSDRTPPPTPTAVPTPGFRGRLRPLAAVALTGALAAGGLAGPVASAVAARPVAALAAARPGLIGAPLIITNQEQFDGYDVGMNRAGTAYVGWISAAAGDSALRTVHLCVVPAGHLTCVGGVRSTPSLSPSGAGGLHVLVAPSGGVTLVWFADWEGTGPRTAHVVEATVSAAGGLSAPVIVANAPAYGSVEDARIGPDHRIWTVALGSAGSGPVQVRDGGVLVGALPSPWAGSYFGTVKLAFAGSTPVLVATKAGAVTTPDAVASRQGTRWTPFRGIGGTWAVGTDLGLVSTSSGVRLLASTADASYYPVVGRWTGSAFARPTLTGERNNCAPSSHDPVTDGSGRVADVSWECSQVAVANLPNTTRASVFRFDARGTPAGGTPQIATTPSGRGIVAWSVETDGSTNIHLYIAAVRLGDLTVSRTKGVRGGKITVTGPVSCLPAVAVPVGMRARAAGGWQVAATSLRLNGNPFGRRLLDGAALTPGAKYTLTALATFTSGGVRAKGSVALVFRACGRP